jgi:hypothetical protein
VASFLRHVELCFGAVKTLKSCSLPSWSTHLGRNSFQYLGASSTQLVIAVLSFVAETHEVPSPICFTKENAQSWKHQISLVSFVGLCAELNSIRSGPLLLFCSLSGGKTTATRDWFHLFMLSRSYLVKYTVFAP